MQDEKNIFERKKKLDVKEILIQTVLIYKAGWKQYIGLTAIAFVILFLLNGAQIAMHYSFAAGMLLLLLSIGSIYFMLKAYVAIYMLTKSMVHGVKLSVKEAYRSSDGLVGTYFIVSLLYGLIVMIPALGMALSFQFADNRMLKIGLILFFAVPFLYLFTRYYLAIPSAMLSGQQNGEFKSSSRLVKGNFWRVLAVIFVSYGIFYLLDQLLSRMPQYPESGLLQLILRTAAELAIQFVMTPIGTIAAVLMYLSLNASKGADCEKISGEAAEQEGSVQLNREQQ